MTLYDGSNIEPSNFSSSGPAKERTSFVKKIEAQEAKSVCVVSFGT